MPKRAIHDVAPKRRAYSDGANHEVLTIEGIESLLAHQFAEVNTQCSKIAIIWQLLRLPSRGRL